MGFLNDLFKSNTKTINNDTKKLVDCVVKVDKGTHGVFVSIMNDLEGYNNSVGNNDSNERKMAYAYARRAAASGLCAQGIWGQEEFDYVNNVFQAFQQNITLELEQYSYEDTVKFQEDSWAQALELIQSYDSRLNKDFLVTIGTLMMEDAEQSKRLGHIFSVDDLFEMFSPNNDNEIENIGDLEHRLKEMDEEDKDKLIDYLNIIKEMNVQDEEYGNTLLISSVIQGDENAVSSLLDWGADINIRNYNNQTALEIAFALEYKNNNSRREIITSIINSCLKNKILDYFDAEDSLLKASENNDVETVEKLINAGMFLNFQDQDEDYLETALMKAVKNNNIEIVEMLINAGANLNLQQDLGYTALIIAIIEDHTEIACLLIEAGADYNIASTYGNMSAVVWAINGNQNGSEKIMNALKKVGAIS